MTDKPTIPEVLPLVRSYYALPGNAVGGSLHLMLDDGNVDDDSARYCLAYAQAQNDEPGIHLASLLVRMSKTQRRKLAMMDHYHWTAGGN